MRSQKTLQMAEIALMSAVLCVVSPFTIPVPASPVPFSLALFAVYLAAVLLGAKRGAACVLVYLFLGAVGLPVFSGFSGGIGVLLGPTGGYLFGYVFCAAAVGVIAGREFAGKPSGRKSRPVMRNVLAMVCGTLLCYFFGTIWFLAVMNGTYTVAQAFLVCVMPYLIFDTIKILAAAAVALPIKRILRRIERQ